MSLSAGRTFVILTNTLTLIAGLILVGIGIYGIASPDVRLYSNIIPLATIIVGVLVFLISIVGCCGAVWENRTVLKGYFIILLILVLLQLIVVIISLIDTQNIESILNKGWQTAYDKHPKVIRDIEDEYSCCGFKDVHDRAIPKRSPEACTESPWFGYKTSCYQSLYDSYKRHQTALGIWGIILAVIQVLALVFAFILIRRLPDDEERERDYRSEHQRLVQEGRGDPGRGTTPYHVPGGRGVHAPYGST
ncbi:hypothetical protein G9A89_005999 [Geosiphon pyriformis]|nr:hypothetical protein G9A89_005999 [Geosiphon pyriformis]